MKTLTLTLQKATDLVLEADTQDKIKHALNVMKHPVAWGFSKQLEISEYQRKMMIEQLELNSCALAVHKAI